MHPSSPVDIHDVVLAIVQTHDDGEACSRSLHEQHYRLRLLLVDVVLHVGSDDCAYCIVKLVSWLTPCV